MSHNTENDMTRIRTRLTAIAAITAFSGYTGFGAQALEATQWNPQAEQAVTASADATRAQTAWANDLGEATQFRDGIARDTMTSRAEVRSDLRFARNRGLLNDTGEAGATERVLAAREAFAQEEHGRLLALSTMPDDPLGDMIASMALADTWYPDSFAAASMAEFMPDDTILLLPTDQQDVVAMGPEDGALVLR